MPQMGRVLPASQKALASAASANLIYGGGVDIVDVPMHREINTHLMGNITEPHIPHSNHIYYFSQIACEDIF